MKFKRTWATALMLVLLGIPIIYGIYGCAGAGKAIQTGITAIEIIDGFYDAVVAQKSIPTALQAATIILQQADTLATMAKAGKNTADMVAQARLLAAQAGRL